MKKVSTCLLKIIIGTVKIVIDPSSKTKSLNSHTSKYGFDYLYIQYLFSTTLIIYKVEGRNKMKALDPIRPHSFIFREELSACILSRTRC